MSGLTTLLSTSMISILSREGRRKSGKNRLRDLGRFSEMSIAAAVADPLEFVV